MTRDCRSAEDTQTAEEGAEEAREEINSVNIRVHTDSDGVGYVLSVASEPPNVTMLPTVCFGRVLIILLLRTSLAHN